MAAANEPKKGKGRTKKVKEPKRTVFNTEVPSDLSDIDEDLLPAAAAVASASPEADRSMRGSSTEQQHTSAVTSSGGERKRALSVTSFASDDGTRAPVAEAAQASDGEDSDAVGKVLQAKKRRVVVDSDDDD